MPSTPVSVADGGTGLTALGMANKVLSVNGTGTALVYDWGINQHLQTIDSPQFAGLNLGHATDTALARVSAGVVAISGNNILTSNLIGTSVQAFDADILKADTSDDLQAGYTATSASQGTKSSGTFTPSFASRNIQHCTNGGAFTLGVPTGHGSLVLDITNNSSAGTITTSGFTLVTGDDFTTTNGHKFRCYITCGNAGSHLHVVAFQ